MRHMEQTRRVAVDNHIPHDLLAANPCPDSACAYCRAYHQFPIPSLLLPPVSPVVDSSAIHPLHTQPCSTASHRRCWPPAGHAAAIPPRLPTTLTGAPFRSTTVYMFAIPQSQPSSRFPSHLLIAHHPLSASSKQERSSSPFLFKVLLFCIPISSRTDFVVSQLPPLQNIVQKSWARCACSMYYFRSICCERPESVVSSPSQALPALSFTRSTPLTCGRLATCQPLDTSPPDQSELSILSVLPTTCDARACRRLKSPRRLPQHILFSSNAFYFLRRRS
jgi:hypothetical protein